MPALMVNERAAQLTAARLPFVHATVVRAQEPTSARAGDDAVILADGSIEGFVGGVCAETSVRVAALDALKDGTSLLLRVLPEDTEAFPETPGARIAINPCHSGGAVEIFLRPVLPRPLVAVQGTTPIGTAIRELAVYLDFEVAEGGFAGVTAAIVAGLGRDEEAALRGALDASVPFVALVASHKRAAVVLDAMQLTDLERARIRTHPGLDIGARTPKEIALSILAEIVREMRTGGLAAPASPAAPAAELLSIGPPVPLEMEAPRRVVDPVCGMTVMVRPETPHAVVDGMDHWYCCPGCLRKHAA